MPRPDIDRLRHMNPASWKWRLWVNTDFSSLNNTQAKIHIAMNTTLFSVKWQLALMYVDNIMVFLKIVNNDMAHLQKLLPLRQDTRVTVREKKCWFDKEKLISSARLNNGENGNYPQQQAQPYRN